MGFIVSFCTIIAPGIILLSILYFSFLKKSQEVCPSDDPIESWFIKAHKTMRSWAMIDVYIFAIIASIIKLSEIVNTEIGIGTWILAVLWLCIYIADKNFIIDYQAPIIKLSRQKTFLYALSALFILIPANIFPLITLVKTGKPYYATLWESIEELLHGPTWAIGIIILLASFISPWVKIFSLWFLSLSAGTSKYLKFKKGLHKFIEIIGRWAMIDIFVGATLVSIVRLDALASVKLEIGTIYFSLMVVLTILASSAFDTRIIGKK